MDCTVSPIFPLAAATRKVTIVATGFSPTNPDCSSIPRLMKDEEIRKLYYIASPMQPHHLECIAVTFTLITLLRARLSLLDCIYTSEGNYTIPLFSAPSEESVSLVYSSSRIKTKCAIYVVASHTSTT